MTDNDPRESGATDEDAAENAALVNRTWNEYWPDAKSQGITFQYSFTPEEASRLTACANACRGIEDPKQLRAMFDAGRKRADEVRFERLGVIQNTLPTFFEYVVERLEEAALDAEKKEGGE